VELLKNTLGKLDASGRRGFVPVAGSEHTVMLDTLIAAIGEQLLLFAPTGSEGIEVSKQGTVVAEAETLAAQRPGVFAGGDAVTGPASVVRAIAAGRRGAMMMDRHIRGEELKQPWSVRRPHHHIPPTLVSAEALEELRRADPPTVAMATRKTSFVEVELALNEKDAIQEASRCLRCDLEFTKPVEPAKPHTHTQEARP
jgi:NADH-quinone oxidoreductase subunit F